MFFRWTGLLSRMKRSRTPGPNERISRIFAAIPEKTFTHSVRCSTHSHLYDGATLRPSGISGCSDEDFRLVVASACAKSVRYVWTSSQHKVLVRAVMAHERSEIMNGLRRGGTNIVVKVFSEGRFLAHSACYRWSGAIKERSGCPRPCLEFLERPIPQTLSTRRRCGRGYVRLFRSPQVGLRSRGSPLSSAACCSAAGSPMSIARRRVLVTRRARPRSAAATTPFRRSPLDAVAPPSRRRAQDG